MSIRKWVSLFISTLILGGVTALIAGLIAEWDIYTKDFATGDLIDFFKSTVLLFGTGCLFSVLSQMGFFAYLTFHRICLGMFGSPDIWGKVQLVLIAFVFFDLVYFRHHAFASKDESILNYFFLPILLLIVSLVIALWKKRETNRYAFIPTIFFMFVVTTLEWLPVLKQNDFRWLWIMGITLVLCNAYQVLKLHRMLKKS
ncbi:KinB signaling pathway activation protein [Scopulibacillus darangshiensis]|uniref:KinB signaling pathway activation protein n=1 Tax=Scopulibacillus darangshiensis TaxID=442528 RepID=A0A4R2NRS2_9BACL|nr:KinB-signaling pathway activation protein [Scopulibacillus darangshiensis]TCP24201.1 KinB signaling pathway activation protein [Scopulibacillus darangshiensis]